MARGGLDHLQGLVEPLSADDEIVIALGASVVGHPHYLIADHYEDLKEMGHDVDNPAGVWNSS